MENPHGRLEGKATVVTGGIKRIGQGIVVRILKEDANGQRLFMAIVRMKSGLIQTVTWRVWCDGNAAGI